MNEFRLLETLKHLPKKKSVILGPGDDAAMIKWDKKYLLFCGDMLIEDVHFNLRDYSFAQIGHRAVARTLSDIAAMSGVPHYLGVSLALPPKYIRHISKILKGVKEIAEAFNIDIVGGDMSKASKIFIDTWCLGSATLKKTTTRTNARNNDGIFVTGKLGKAFKTKKYIIPRINEALFLSRNFPIHAMIDISDGLVLDLYRILKESNKSAALLEDCIPCNKNASLNNALYDGEDYELLFTAPLAQRNKIEKAGSYYIGTIYESQRPKVTLSTKNNEKKELDITGYFCI